jgi:NitT/TauT family transport system substrate-binding protein
VNARIIARLRTAVGIAGALALALVAGSPARSAESPATKVTFLQPLVCICGAPYYVAQKLGYFKDEGLDVDIVTIQGTPAMFAAMQAGSGQFAITNGPSLLTAIPKGIKLVAIAGLEHGLSDFNMVVSPAYARRHGISANEDYKSVLRKLAGARIGVLGTTSTGGLVLAGLRNEVGLPDDAFTMIAMKPAASVAALAHGQIDAWWQTSPALEGVVAFRSSQVPSMSAVAGDVVFTTQDYVAKNAAVIARMARAIARADNAIVDPKIQERALEAVYERIPELPHDVIKAEMLKPGVPVVNGALTDKEWTLTNAFDAKIGLLQKPLSPAQLSAAYTTKFVPKTTVRP